MILDETYELIRQKAGTLFTDLAVEKAIFGLRVTAVRLSDGSAGIASTLMPGAPHCEKQNRDFSDFTPGNFTDQKVEALFRTEKKSELIDTLRIAVLNAISSKLISEGKYHTIENADPIDLIDLDGNKNIVMVGAFSSYISKIAATRSRLTVLEFDKEAIPDQHRDYFAEAHRFAEFVPQADLLIITGLTLINGTIDALLQVVGHATKVIVTGPSGSVLPDVLFRHKVNIVGATRIIDQDRVFEIAAQAGAGYHLFKNGAQKICILND